jgi:hypothetical protein
MVTLSHSIDAPTERGYTTVLILSSRMEKKKKSSVGFLFFLFLKSGPVQTGRPPPGEGADGGRSLIYAQ